MGLITKEEFVIVSTKLRSGGDTSKVPTVQFTSKGTVFGFTREEFGHDLLGKYFTIANDKGLAVGQPTNRVRVRFVIEDFVQAHRKDFRIIVFIIMVMVLMRLFGVFVGAAHGG